MSEWIPIKDRCAPQDGSAFLGYDGSKEYCKIYVLRYHPPTSVYGVHGDYREASGEEYYEFNPTHWMPLPEPPK